jgi:hypothetical protein
MVLQEWGDSSSHDTRAITGDGLSSQGIKRIRGDGLRYNRIMGNEAELSGIQLSFHQHGNGETYVSKVRGELQASVAFHYVREL